MITASSKLRFGFAVISGLLHVLISWWFNFDWIHTDPGAIDGGPLGFFSWAIPALAGTLACDAVRASGPKAALRIGVCGLPVMLFGWSLSIGTTLYNVPVNQSSTVSQPFAPDPVVPSIERMRSWEGTIVEPPFVPPPASSHRKLNYWMMSQRFGTISYLTFSAGLCLLVYAIFLWGSDAMNWRIGFLRTLGTNSLAAYLLHDVAGWILPSVARRFSLPLFDETSISISLTLASFACFTLFVYALCRLLERLGWYIRV